MNKVCLIGRVTKDVELRTTGTGKTNCKFNIAIDRPPKSDGTREADFPSIVAWNKTAELCARFLHKGDRVGIDGRIQTGSYQRDGQTIYTTDVVADRVEFLTPKSQTSEPLVQMTGNVTEDGFAEVLDDQLPFD